MNTITDVITTEGLIKHRGDFTLGPIDLRVPQGFVTGILGANGSGKTTTLRTLLGLMWPDAGTIDLPAMDRVGTAFDQPFVLPDWRVQDAATAYAAFRPGWDQSHVDALLRRFGINTGTRVKDLSRGEGSKLMIALAMGNHPDLLVLDEPTSGLDPAARADLVDLLREHMNADASSLLFSTHITSDLENFADYMVLIDGGRVIYQDTLERMLEDFAYVHGALDGLTEANRQAVHGLRRSSSSFDGIIRTADSASFGSTVQLETPSIEQIAVHLTRSTSFQEA